jgi:hypothetical protein
MPEVRHHHRVLSLPCTCVPSTNRDASSTAAVPLLQRGANPAAAAAAAIQDNEHIPMVIDLGSHWLEGLASSIVPGSPAMALQGVRLTQIVTRRLAPRAAHFPSLATQRQVSLAIYLYTPSVFWLLLVVRVFLHAVVDLGSHWLDGPASSVVPGSPAMALQGVRLRQVVTRRLAPRAAHFPALATQRQVRLVCITCRVPSACVRADTCVHVIACCVFACMRMCARIRACPHACKCDALCLRVQRHVACLFGGGHGCICVCVCA